MIRVAKFGYLSFDKRFLTFFSGNKILIKDSPNKHPDWLYGTNQETGENGLFPKNYTTTQELYNSYYILSNQSYQKNRKSFRFNSMRLTGDKQQFEHSNFLNNSNNKKKKIELSNIKTYKLRAINSLPIIPIYETTLLKVCEKTGKWEKRYCTLKDKTIYLYKKDQTINNSNPINEIDLSNLICIKKKVFQNKNLNKFCFQLIFSKKIIFFELKNKQFMKNWINSIKLIQLFLHFSSRKCKIEDRLLIEELLNYIPKKKNEIKQKQVLIEINLLKSKIKTTELNFLQNNAKFYEQCLKDLKQWKCFLIIKLDKILKKENFYNCKALVIKDYQPTENKSNQENENNNKKKNENKSKQENENENKVNNGKVQIKKKSNKLILKKNNIINLIEIHQNTMCLGEINGKIGWFPFDNMKLILYPFDNIDDKSNKKKLNLQSGKLNLQNEGKRKSKKKYVLNDSFEISYEIRNILNEVGFHYQGYLMKQLTNKKKWKKRFFLLINNYLHYYKHEESTIPNLIVNLGNIDRICNATIKTNQENCFEIINKKRPLLLFSDDRVKFNQWVENLQLAINAKNYKKLITENDIEENQNQINLLLNYINELIEKNVKKQKDLYNKKLTFEKKSNYFELKPLITGTKKNMDKKKNKIINDSYNPYFYFLQKYLTITKKLVIYKRYKNKLLGILARLNFPNMVDKEIAYSVESNTNCDLQKNELKFEKNQWFILLKEIDEKYLQVETMNEIGIVPREKLEIIDLPKINKIFLDSKKVLLKYKKYKNIKNSKFSIYNKININIYLKSNNLLSYQNIKIGYNNNDNDKKKDNDSNNNSNNNNIIIINNKNKNKSNNNNNNNDDDDDDLNDEERIIKLYQQVLYEEKMKQSFPIYKEGLLKILKGKKYISKHFRLKSWFFGFYDDKDKIQPYEVIDFRCVTFYDFDSQSKNSNEFTIKTKGGLSKLFIANNEDEVYSWLYTFNICKLFQELSQHTTNNENSNEIMTKKYFQLVQWVNKQIQINVNQQQELNAIINFNKNSFLLENKLKTVKNNSTKEELKQLNSNLDLLKIWKKRLLGKAARLTINDPDDFRIRVFCLRDYNGDTKLNELSFKKGEFLILIRKAFNGVIQAKKNEIVGNIKTEFVELVKPSKIEAINSIGNQNGMSNNNDKFFGINIHNRNNCEILDDKDQDSHLQTSKDKKYKITKRLIKLKPEGLLAGVHGKYLPTFLQTPVLIEKKIGSNKWNKRILLIDQWNLSIFHRNSLEFEIDVRTIISFEKCLNLIDHNYGFIVSNNENEIRFIVETNGMLEEWLYNLQIIKNLQLILKPLEEQKYENVKNKYYILINHLSKVKKKNENNLRILSRTKTKLDKEITDELNFLNLYILILNDWLLYILSRICRLRIIEQRDFYCQDYTLKDLIEDDRERAYCLQSYQPNNEEELKGVQHGCYLITNKFSDIDYQARDEMNNMKQVNSKYFQIIVPEIINIEHEFPKKSVNLKSEESSLSNNSDSENNLLSNKLQKKKHSERESYQQEKSEKKMNIRRAILKEDEGGGDENVGEEEDEEEEISFIKQKGLGDLIFNKQKEDISFYQLFNLNKMNDKEAIDLAKKCLLLWDKIPESVFNFPIFYQNYLSLKPKIHNQWAVLSGWLLFFYLDKSSDQSNKVYDLRTLNLIIMDVKILILRFSDDNELKLYTQDEKIMKKWLKYFNMIKKCKDFLSESNRNEEPRLKLIKLNTVYDWINKKVSKLKLNQKRHKKLLQFHTSNGQIKTNSKLYQTLERIKKQLISLYYWRKRLLVNISKLDLTNQLNNETYNQFGIINKENNIIQDYYQYTTLKYHPKEWIIILNNNFKINNNDKADSLILGMKSSNHDEIGLIFKNDIWILTKKEINTNFLFNFNTIGQSTNYSITINHNQNTYNNGSEKNIQNNDGIDNLDRTNRSITTTVTVTTTNNNNMNNMNNNNNNNTNNTNMNKIFNYEFQSTSKMNSKLLKEIGSIPIFYEGEIWTYYSGLRSTWKKRYIKLYEFNFLIYLQTNNIKMELLKNLNLENSFEIKRITDLNAIPLINLLPNSSLKSNVFEIVIYKNNKKKSYIFATEDAGTRFEWIYHFKNLMIFKEIFQPLDINYKNERKGHYSQLVDYLSDSITAIETQTNNETNLFKFYNENPNQYINELISLEKKIKLNQKILKRIHPWREKILQLLLRLKLNDNNDYQPRAYLLKKIKYIVSKNKNNEILEEIIILPKEFVKIVPKFNNDDNDDDDDDDNNYDKDNDNKNKDKDNINNYNSNQSQIIKNEQLIVINNEDFLKIIPAKPEVMVASYPTNGINGNSTNQLNNKEKKKNEEENILSNEGKTIFYELLTHEDFLISQSFLKMVNFSDLEVLARNFPILLETKKLNLQLLKLVITNEVDKTSYENTLFRRNSIASKLITAYTNRVGITYLKKVIRPIVVEMSRIVGSFEIDENKLIKGENLSDNRERLKKYSIKIMNSILNSIRYCPLVLRDLASILCISSEMKFPQAKYLIISGFFFLRFISPTIVIPESFGIIQEKPTPRVRRGLLLISKIIQGIANLAPFKDESLKYLDDLVVHFEQKIKKFMDKLVEPVLVVKLKNKKLVTIISTLENGQLLICKGNKLTLDYEQISMEELYTNTQVFDYVPESFELEQQLINTALIKLYKIFKIENYQNKFKELFKDVPEILQLILDLTKNN
ncbi:neurofibromin [Anaeramoeba flamelloides]|uniref:Neurofibromin n=1 Tax=Anaeramoeba flamelloides TaxID=1746091 RepID=A0AAV7YDV5_9EUKA|nr:neurofibromin [Anaeramoeba flamelloides]